MLKDALYLIAVVALWLFLILAIIGIAADSLNYLQVFS